MNKDEAMEQVKKIGLRAVEDMVKDVAIPMLGDYLKKKSTWGVMIYTALIKPVKEMADKIDGEVG